MLLDFFTSFTSKIKSERRIVLSVLCLVSVPLAVVLTGSLLYVRRAIPVQSSLGFYPRRDVRTLLLDGGTDNPPAAGSAGCNTTRNPSGSTGRFLGR